MKYKISGEVKPSLEQKTFCKTCGDGKLFDNEKIIRTDACAEKHHEKICHECVSKFKIPYVVFDLEYDISPGREISQDELDAFDCDTTLTAENKDLYALSIAEQFSKDLLVHSDELDFESYNETGMCLEHKNIQSIPIITSEGNFVFDICAVCKTCSVRYKGKIITMPFKDLVSFLLAKSEDYEIKKQQVVPDVSLFNTDIFGELNVPEF